MSTVYYPGTLQSVSQIFTNPYSGETLNVTGDWYVNDIVQTGTVAFDFYVTDDVNNLVLLEDSNGTLMFSDIEVFTLQGGNDIMLFASSTFVMPDIFAFGQSGNDIIWMNAGNDTVAGGTGDDILHGGPGNDVIEGGEGADIIDGGDGIDTADYSLNSADEGLAVFIDLENGVFSGGEAEGDVLLNIENVTGSNNATERDMLYGDDGVNVLMGMDGADFLEGGGGADTLDGGDGWDYARYTRSDEAVHINLKTNVNTGGDAEGDLIYNVEAVVGSQYNDTIIGGDDKDYLRGDDGDDYLDGGLGGDQLFGWHGNDTYYYAAGRDTIHEWGGGIDRVIFDPVWKPQDVSFANDVMTFTVGVHELIFNDVSLVEFFSFDGFADMTLSQLLSFGTSNVSTNVGTSLGEQFIGTSAVEGYDGMGGFDVVDYTASTEAVRVDLLAGIGSAGDADGDTYISIEGIYGSDDATQRDYIWGDDGDNEIRGYAGHDILEGGAGADVINGGDGWDYARYIRSDAGVNINFNTGTYSGGHAEGDFLVNIEAVIGSSHNDVLHGSVANDYFKGEAGDDILIGDLGRDLLYGGSGADTFVFLFGKTFDRADMIRDFDASEGDVIDISALLGSYDELTHAISDFVQLSQNGNNTDVHIREFGDSPGQVFKHALTIEHGVTVTLEQLINDGSIIV